MTHITVVHAPLPRIVAARHVLSCVARSAVMLTRRQVHLAGGHVGHQLHFADGSTGWIYRETYVDVVPVDPCLLEVGFRLRWVRGRAHTLFRMESLLNTPLFVGFPGFVSKLWVANDENDRYRGIYEWDGAWRAEQYARALWRVLELVSVPGSIDFEVLPSLRREDVLADPGMSECEGDGTWWRLTG